MRERARYWTDNGPTSAQELNGSAVNGILPSFAHRVVYYIKVDGDEPN